MHRSQKLLDAIRVLLKARSRPAVGQQVSLFGSHAAGPTTAVHVAEHLRRTDHGVQLVHAHEQHRHAAAPAHAPAPPPVAAPKDATIVRGYADRHQIPSIGATLRRPDGSFRVVTGVGRPSPMSDGLARGYAFDDGWAVTLQVREPTQDEIAADQRQRRAAEDAQRAAAEAAAQDRVRVADKLAELRAAGWREVVYDREVLADVTPYASEGTHLGAVSLKSARLDGQPVWFARREGLGGADQHLWVSPDSEKALQAQRSRLRLVFDSVLSDGYDPDNAPDWVREVLESPNAAANVREVRALGIERHAERNRMREKLRQIAATGILTQQDAEAFYAYHRIARRVGEHPIPVGSFFRDDEEPPGFRAAMWERGKDHDIVVKHQLASLLAKPGFNEYKWPAYMQIEAEADRRGTRAMMADELGAVRARLLGTVLEPSKAKALMARPELSAYHLARLDLFARTGEMDKLPKKMQAAIRERVAAAAT